MGIADFLDTTLSSLPGYREAALWPAQQQAAGLGLEQARLKNQRAGIENSSIQSLLDDMTRERTERAAAPGAASRVMSAYAPRPSTVTSEVTGPAPEGEQGDLGNQPSITTATPGRPAARTLPDLLSRGASAEDYDLAAKYRPNAMTGLGLVTPEVAEQRNVEQQARQEKLAGAQRATGLQGALDALDPSAEDYPAQVRGVITRMSAGAHPGEVLKDLRRGEAGAGGGQQPETMDIGGERWSKVPNLETGVPQWHRAPPVPEHESAIQDWIASHPRDIVGLSPQDARDKARAAIQARTVATRVSITQPTLGQDAVDRAAEYVNQTGQLPAGLGFGNQRLRTQILDRAAQMATETGGDLGLAAKQANFKANQSELTRLQSQRGPVIAFMNTAEHHLARAEQLSQAVDRTEIPVLNNWLLSGQTNWTGNPQTAQLAAVTRLATAEVAKVISSATGGGGVVSDSARKEVEDVLRPAMAKGQFSAVVGALRSLMHDRASGYDQQIAATNARINGLGGAPKAPPAAPAGGGGVTRWGRDATGNPVPLP